MPKLSVAENPELAKQVLAKALESEKKEKKETPPPEVRPAPDNVFQLCGGYWQNDGVWTTEFEVRELTGRDEEYLSRIKDPAKMMIGIIERGLVRVGDDPSSREVMDSLLSGDWDTVMLAIRVVTFGPEVEVVVKCRNCSSDYEAKVHLLDNVERRTATSDEMHYTVEGRKGTVYTLSAAYGSLQRKILTSSPDSTASELNTLVLSECVQKIGPMPVVNTDSVRNLSMADRALLLDEINKRVIGPMVNEVRTECPNCGADQELGLSIAAMFR
jgi:hypothetical protein